MSDNTENLQNDVHDADVTSELPKPVLPEDLPEVGTARETVFTRIRRHPAVTAGIGAAIVAVLGLGIAFGMPSKPTSSMAKPAQNAAISQVSTKKAAKQKISLAIEADGWADGDGEFGYAIVDADGKEVAKGEADPAKGASVKLAQGAYALNITSIPTAKDGKTTWIVPKAVDFTVFGKDSKVTVKLAKVDMTDDAAVAAALDKLPEAEKKAAQELIAAKKENPSASTVSAPVSKPSAAAVKKAESQASAKPASSSASNKGESGSASKPSSNSFNKTDGGSSKPSGSSSSSSTKKDDSKPSSGNSGASTGSDNSGSSSTDSSTTKPAEPEKVWAVVTPAWDEQVYHPAVTHTETQKIKVGVQYQTEDGNLFDNEDDASYYAFTNGMGYSCLPKYETQTVTVTDQEAWTETIHHDAVYGWVEK